MATMTADEFLLMPDGDQRHARYEERCGAHP